MIKAAAAEFVSKCPFPGILSRSLRFLPAAALIKGAALRSLPALVLQEGQGVKALLPGRGVQNILVTSIMVDTQEALRSFAHLGIKH